MRVLFQSRLDLFTVRGGDTVIVEKLAEVLGRRGVEAVVDGAPEPDLAGFDLIHLLNVGHRDCYFHGLRARQHRKPLAITTAYWSQDEMVGRRSPHHSAYAESWRRRVRRRGWALLDRLGLQPASEARRRRERAVYYRLGARGMARALVEQADLLLPSAPRERELLLRSFPSAAAAEIRVAPYGVDAERFGRRVPGADNLFLRRYGRRDFLLCVGRVEPRKNQARLLEAARGLGLPVVLVGAATDAAYAERVRRQLSPRDLWVPSWSPIDHAYSLARLHALPSVVEIPGLVSLEAAALGVPVVVGNRGSERDYLGEHADYCDPADPGDIRRALEAALRRPCPAKDLARHVRAHFTWEHSAERVLEGYRRILG